MKTYEEIIGQDYEVIKATLADGRELWIPLDPANSDYAEYLRYTEWVEAGNDPDEFWTQSEGEI
jgi:hypothetical protein